LIVLDHFHVKKYLNDALDAVRKEELHRQEERTTMSFLASFTAIRGLS